MKNASAVVAAGNDVSPASGQQDELLNFATRLVGQLEAGEIDEANQTIYQLCKMRESSLFQEIGKLTRDLHETLNSFAHDEKLETLMQESLPDAKKRLDYVVQLTEESTHKTLNAVEQCMPITADLKQGAEGLQATLNLPAETGAAEKKSLDAFLLQAVRHSDMLNSCLTEILMAQTFQDVTGQVIQRVIKLVQDVEASLVGMIRACGTSSSGLPGEAGNTKAAGGVKAASMPEKNNHGYGPSVPGIDNTDDNSDSRVQSQDEVDDLLSTLGF
ncbi:MAG TPA: protein phosphatase CheZ [Thiotrichales bacterium]|nr:protein phosphatase CheZ [Thiotrichales bacterium]